MTKRIELSLGAWATGWVVSREGKNGAGGLSSAPAAVGDRRREKGAALARNGPSKHISDSATERNLATSSLGFRETCPQ